MNPDTWAIQAAADWLAGRLVSWLMEAGDAVAQMQALGYSEEGAARLIRAGAERAGLEPREVVQLAVEARWCGGSRWLI